MSTKRTFQPGSKRRVRKLGFRAKMKTLNGRKILKRRKERGRKSLTP